MEKAMDLLKEMKEYKPRLHDAIPEVMTAMGSLTQETYKDGALSRQTKELIALAIALCQRCDTCIVFHIMNALQAGATKKQIMETVGIAIQRCGAPSMVQGVKVIKYLDELTAGK